jgi:hypothetical protein
MINVHTGSELIQLVDMTARAIKAYDSSLQVGANGCALPYAPWVTDKPNPYSWGLIGAYVGLCIMDMHVSY